VNERETRAELFAALEALAGIVPEMRGGQLMAAVGELCADLHGRGLWEADDTELLEAVRQFRRSFEAATVAQSGSEAEPPPWTEAGNRSFGFFKPDYTPRKAAVYLHNLTTILADQGSIAKPGQLNYSIPDQPATVHEMLLQKSDGTFELAVWNERLKGADHVTVRLGRTHPAVRVYDPTIGTDPIQNAGRVDAVKLTLSDHPLIIAMAQK
jgi:hypothetical protein